MVLLVLATAFITLAYVADRNEEWLRTLPATARAAIGIVVVIPFILSILAYMLRVKALQGDEYQANMLQQRMAYATMASILYTLMKGFIDQYGEQRSAPFYIWPAIYWYLIFWFSGLFGPYKP